jgi:hypothetical protein
MSAITWILIDGVFWKSKNDYAADMTEMRSFFLFRKRITILVILSSAKTTLE